MARARKHRRYTPHTLGPRVEQRGRYWTCDMRPWGGSRYTKLRDPEHPGWPRLGEFTEDETVAREWAMALAKLHREDKRRAQLKLPPRPKSLAAATTEYLEHRKATVERNTYGTDRTSLNHLLDFCDTVGAKSTNDITPKVVQALIDDRIRQGYERSTVYTYAGSICVFCEWIGVKAMFGELVIPEAEKREAFCWSDGEAVELRRAAAKLDRIVGNANASRALEIGLSIGLRQREIFALRWEQIREVERVARVKEQLVRDSLLAKSLKSDEPRTALILQEWWTVHRPMAGLIVNIDGRPLGDRRQRSLIQRIMDIAGLTQAGVGWHACRHTYARVFIERGGRLQELQKSLGHSSITTTEQTYGHLQEDVAARLAGERIYGTHLKLIGGE